jgi:maltooligosyltrehalose trehalohydrolase
MPFGAEVDGSRTRFRLWAPGARHVELLLGAGEAVQAHALARNDDGWHEATIDDAAAGTAYRFRIDGDLRVPDPASRANPDGVHAPSRVVDPHAFDWQDAEWRGRPWHEAVVYELHVGTFTPEGTFAAAADRLDHLAALGVTAIEILPVAAFAGRHGWGYDGVLPFAPHAAYGTPDDMKRFVEAAHARRLMVLLDVVYNHFGPEGNYLHAYAPQFFNPRHQTPWGPAINFDGDGNATVREFYVDNAIYWLEEFHLDGLRLDAVHAIADDSRPHIVDEIASRVRDRFGDERHVHLVLENDRNEASRLARDGQRRPLCADAQWNDDWHHALHVAITGERDGYYRDYADRPLHYLARALAEGFVYQGQPSPFRGAAPRGEASTHLPPAAFVVFAQNHDQIGNRALGERLWRVADPGLLDTAIATLLLAPSIPLLFMGDEFDASSPFLYFCDYGPELGAAVASGRREEFCRFASFGGPSPDDIPDPNARATFEASKLDWRDAGRAEGERRLALYRRCLAARGERIVPIAAAIDHGGTFRVDDEVITVRWPTHDGRVLSLCANFSARDRSIPSRGARLLHAEPAGGFVAAHARLAAGAVVAMVEGER